jgi:hypothetical protein
LFGWPERVDLRKIVQKHGTIVFFSSKTSCFYSAVKNADVFAQHLMPISKHATAEDDCNYCGYYDFQGRSLSGFEL